MSFFDPRTFAERVAAQRQAEQMRLESGPVKKLHCACGRLLKANSKSTCFQCQRSEYDRKRNGVAA